MTEFTIHDETTAPEDIQDFLVQTKKRNGFIPNLHAIMSEAPGLLKGYRELNDLFLKSSFNRDEITVIWQTVNVENNCHSMVAKSMKIDEEITESLRNETPFSDPKLEALRTFTLQMVRKHGVLGDQDVKAFLDAGYTNRNMLEVILGVAMKTMSNYTNHLAQTPLDIPFQSAAWEKIA